VNLEASHRMPIAGTALSLLSLLAGASGLFLPFQQGLLLSLVCLPLAITGLILSIKSLNSTHKNLALTSTTLSLIAVSTCLINTTRVGPSLFNTYTQKILSQWEKTENPTTTAVQGPPPSSVVTNSNTPPAVMPTQPSPTPAATPTPNSTPTNDNKTGISHTDSPKNYSRIATGEGESTLLGPWQIDNPEGTQVFLASEGMDTDSEKAFGLIAERGTASLKRGLKRPLQNGDSLRLVIDNNDVQVGGEVGVRLLSKNQAPLITASFSGGSTKYRVSDPNQTVETLPFTNQGLEVVFTATKEGYTLYMANLEKKEGSTRPPWSKISGSLNERVAEIELFNNNAGPDLVRAFYLGNLTVSYNSPPTAGTLAPPDVLKSIRQGLKNATQEGMLVGLGEIQKAEPSILIHPQGNPPEWVERWLLSDSNNHQAEITLVLRETETNIEWSLDGYTLLQKETP